MKQLTIKQGCFRLTDYQSLIIPELILHPGEHLAIIGQNGSGKSALAQAISGMLPPLTGDYDNQFHTIRSISFESLQQLLTIEWQQNNNDFLTADASPLGRTCQQVIVEGVETDPICVDRCHALACLFSIEHLLAQPFASLSTGETRKALLCQSLIHSPDLLILDEPFDGLDQLASQQLMTLLATLILDHDTAPTLVIIVNRLEQIPTFIKQVAVIDRLVLRPVTSKIAALAALSTLTSQPPVTTLPESPYSEKVETLPKEQPLIELRHGTVSYQGRTIIHDLSWRVDRGQHWHIIGPNGAGKSTLLSLITGDHPQGYSNDLTLFGKRRGSGETIWQIKQHIGYISNQLHLDHRLNLTVRDVLLSGFFDSIGLYQIPSEAEKLRVEQWLQLLSLNHVADKPFSTLSWGQQRLLLITRAFVKHPTLLILDEPLQGLDGNSRAMIRDWIDHFIQNSQSQLLFVSHHLEDAPHCINHRLHFIVDGDGYSYQQERVGSRGKQ